MSRLDFFLKSCYHPNMAQGKTAKARKTPVQIGAQRRRTMKNKHRQIERDMKLTTSDQHKAHLTHCKKKWVDGLSG